MSASLLGASPVRFSVKKSQALERNENLSNTRQSRLKERHGVVFEGSCKRQGTADVALSSKRQGKPRVSAR